MKILIIKIGAIGDVIMATSMIPALHTKHPGAKITWLCGKTVAPILNMVDGIDTVIPVDDKKLLVGNIFNKLLALLYLWKILFLKKYDIVINGHPDSRYKLIYLFTIAPLVYKLNRSLTGRTRPVPGRHHSDEYGMLAENYDGVNEKRYKIPAIQKIVTSKKIVCEMPGYPVIVIAPGGAKNILRDDNLRRWPIENYVNLVDALIQKNYNVVLTGSESDLWVSSFFESFKICNLIGKLNLNELVAVMRSSSLLITHDSGPLHFSALAEIPVIALFGPTNPFEKVPRNPHNKILWGGKKLSCRPCYDGKNYAPCSDNICMKDIKVEDVMNAVQEVSMREL